MKMTFLKFKKYLRAEERYGDGQRENVFTNWEPKRGHIMLVDGKKIDAISEMDTGVDNDDVASHTIATIVDGDISAENTDPNEKRDYELYKKVILKR